MDKFKKTIIAVITVILIMSLFACSAQTLPAQTDITEELNLNTQSKEATQYTCEINSAVYDMLDFENTQEYEFATRGLIDAPETLEIKDENGNIVWSQQAYSFVKNASAPATANPSLWENTKNNNVYGLFEVTDGIYQVRGYDMANLTIVEGETGRIVFDPLMSSECSLAAMQLVEKNLGKKPIKAVIISHSHVDHFGGIGGIISQEDLADSSLSIEEQLKSGKIPVIVPENFSQHAVSENIYAGNAMSRRAMYQYGTVLEPGEKGRLAMGIGMGQSVGTVSFLPPTYEIKNTGETITIDGIVFEFQMTPGTEAPCEMNTWLPQKKALWLAENCTGTLHNLYTLRGAQVRDGAAWAKYILEAQSLYGKEADVTFQSHNWPHFGNDNINEYMENTAAVYQFINDKTLAYINEGYTPDEICNMITLPEDLAQNWYTRQYYGTVSHNARAVYQKYMGWYDANPVNLDPLTPSQSAKKWVEYLGDTDEVLRKAKQDYENGEYKWVAEITNVLVFADPENEAARLLCADALEQLGYQAESGTWRNAYLSAAKELRFGTDTNAKSTAAADGGLQKSMTAEMIFDYMGIQLSEQAFKDKDITLNIILADTNEKFTLKTRNGVLLKYINSLSDTPDAEITTNKNALLLLLKGDTQAIKEAMNIKGDESIVMDFAQSLSSGSKNAFFNITEP